MSDVLVVLTGALTIGLMLGLLGSGGSAITVPVLFYMVGHGAKESIAESMAIVALIAAAAAAPYAHSRQIDWRSVWYFGLPGMLGTLLGAWVGGLAPAALQLLVFGGVLIVAAYSMLHEQAAAGDAPLPGEAAGRSCQRCKTIAEGSLVGVVTGFVGVGGGFLIVPALALLGRLPMRIAVGTSLVIIAMKSSVGFAKYQHYLLSQELSVDWRTVAVFALIGVAGSYAGGLINARLDQLVLKRAFAAFLILLGGFVIFSEGRKLVRVAYLPTRGIQTLTENGAVWRRPLGTQQAHGSWRCC